MKCREEVRNETVPSIVSVAISSAIKLSDSTTISLFDVIVVIVLLALFFRIDGAEVRGPPWVLQLHPE